MDYKEFLAYQPLINPRIIRIVEQLLDGTLSKSQFHNRKSYARRRKNLQSILDYSIAFEIASIGYML